MIEQKFKRTFWMAITIALNGLLYLGANEWGQEFGALNMETLWDRQVPFVPNAIITYFLIFPFLATPLFLVRKYDDFVAVLWAYFTLTLASVACFIAFPTTMTRPPLPKGEIGGLFALMRWIDSPNNLCPSLHVSSVVFVATINGYFCPKTRVLSWLCAVLISISTLYAKQHVALDVLAGAGFGIAGYFFAKKLIKGQ